MLQRIKQFLLSPKKVPRKIRGGIFRDIKMELNLTHQTQLHLGLHEREVYGWLRKLSRNIKTAIDIGADEGEYTLYFLTKTSANKILSFEPETKGRTQLMRNLELNHVPLNSRLEVCPKFVSAVDTESELSLDSLLPSIQMPCVIKLDVDGGEIKVLQGASALLALPGSAWIIETHSPDLERQCIELLRKAGFKTTIVPNAWWRRIIPETRPLLQNRWLVATKAKEPEYSAQ